MLLKKERKNVRQQKLIDSEALKKPIMEVNLLNVILSLGGYACW